SHWARNWDWSIQSPAAEWPAAYWVNRVLWVWIGCTDSGRSEPAGIVDPAAAAQYDRPNRRGPCMFELDKAGWLLTARHVPSPNYNARPLDTEVDLLVIHNISLPAGIFGGPHIEALFTNDLDCS